jgi:predicted acylesterase/phospholipase RssA
MRLGLFMTPGAARTAYTVGAVQGLVEDGGLRFDVVAGSSVGVLNGAFAAVGAIDELARQWAHWRSRDVLRVDWRSVLAGAVLFSPNLMRYRAYRTLIVPGRVAEERLPHGIRFRANLANLTTGDQELFEWPGGRIRMADGVKASVSVPAVIRPFKGLDAQWADGLTVDGCPLEDLLLATGVDRVFVVGVTPRNSDPDRRRGVVRMLLRAVEANQQSETTLGLNRAAEVNQLIAEWASDRREVEALVDRLVADPAERARVLAEIDRVYAEVGFPYSRGVVEVIPILPERNLGFWYTDYRPRRSQALLRQGRQDAVRVLETLS